MESNSYFSELVASSWITSARPVAAFSPTPIRGTATQMRPENAAVLSYGASSHREQVSH
jgi:hypothetical protein